MVAWEIMWAMTLSMVPMPGVRKKRCRLANGALTLVLGLLCLACVSKVRPLAPGSPPADASMGRFVYEQPKLGTLFRIVIYAETKALADSAADAAFERVDSLDAILSDYRPESELSRFSAAAQEGSARAQVSKDLYRVLKFSQQVARETKGAFDVSVGPFVRLWRRSRRQGQLPDKGRLATAAAAVGYEKLLLDEKTQQATLSVPGMRLDLGGVAKGYILDQAMEALKSCGIQRALLDGGGDLLASGPPPGQKAWRVTIGAFQSDTSPAAPESTRNGFNLVNSALATSGDAFQFVLIEGVRYSHLIDPTSGLGLTTQRAATVHAPNAMSADAWASALCVLDAKAGIQRLDGMPRLSARCLSPAGVHDSEGFPANLFTQDSRAAE